MELSVPGQYRAAILRQYDTHISRYPTIRQEVEAFLSGKDADFTLCMKYLYGHMASQDVLSGSPSVFAGYVRATLEAFRQLDHLRRLPPEVFFPYVLQHRVNSECLDDSRGVLLRELLPHVQGKTMEQTALCVNYWCYAHATYTPADDRTLGPLAILRRTAGRCGEESVLAVAALRSVGIPARQCYCPRWSHCDDNHAWVEVWIEGHWHYLGACEPEPVLDRGWFTAAASRAMLVDTKCWAHWEGDEKFREVHCTGRYARTRNLTVRVTESGQPVPGAAVRFQIVNYSQLYTLWESRTGESGTVRFEAGPGDLFVYARNGEKVALQKVDLRQTDSVTLELQERFPGQLQADLVPPEDSSGTVPHAEDPHHRQLLQRCEAHLAARRAEFSKAPGYLALAAGNGPELQAFLDMPGYPRSLKEDLLHTLRPKDFADISCRTLVDALDTAMAFQDQYPADIFRDYILAPRIADEMLLPERQAIRSLFPGGFSGPREILNWLRQHMQLLPDEGIRNFYPSFYGCLRCRQVPGFALDAVFVSLCRCFGFPARLEPHTGTAQWLEAPDSWHSIHPRQTPVALTLELPRGVSLRYSEQITLGLWNGEDFSTLEYPDLTLENGHVFRLQPGFYRITVTTRQIDGTASVLLWHLFLAEPRQLQLTPPADQTALRLKQIPLDLPEGPLKPRLQARSGQNLLLIFAAPGSEPTEHLLLEMLECAREFMAVPCRILLSVETPAAAEHPTVKLLMEALPEAELLCLRDSEALAALHRQMQAGDLRLPFVVCMDAQGHGIFADANYRIRMARSLLDVQKILAARQTP